MSLVPVPINKPTEKIYDTCIMPTCGKTLGAESRDLDYRVCHEHRICTFCGKELQPAEVRICHDKAIEKDESIEIAHPRCLLLNGRLTSASLQSDPTISIQQSTYNILNAARLMVDPDMALSIQTNENNAMIRSHEFCQSATKEVPNARGEGFVHELDFDKIYVHLKMLEACVASVNLFIATQDRAAIKKRADLREVEKFKAAKKEAETSSRPVGKKPDDTKEVELAKFMELFSIKERKVAIELKRNRDKAVEMFVKIGVPLEVAIKKCNEDMLSNRKGW